MCQLTNRKEKELKDKLIKCLTEGKKTLEKMTKASHRTLRYKWPH